MKKEKLNLKSIKNVLSRAELKKIMAGSDSGSPGGSGGNCDNYIIPPASFACHDSTGYVIGHATTNCCSNTPGGLQACRNATYPAYTAYVTGPC